MKKNYYIMLVLLPLVFGACGKKADSVTVIAPVESSATPETKAPVETPEVSPEVMEDTTAPTETATPSQTPEVKEEPKKEEVKKEEVKKEEVKKEEVKKEEVKKEEPKQEAPKQEAPKQEAPKQEEPKQEAPKQEAQKQGSVSKSDLQLSKGGATVALDTDIQGIVKKLGTNYNYSESPSCDHDGLDKVFDYSGLELYTYPENDKDKVREILITNKNHKTTKGITVGSTKEEVIAAYGDKYEIIGSNMVYTVSGGEISFYMNSNVVGSISISL